MQPTFFINHGGGPCFFLDPGPVRDTWAGLEAYLRSFADHLDILPTAILVVSGHWEEECATVNTGAAPPLLYDYSGFPAHTYELTWPAPGGPDVAGRVLELLGLSGIEARADLARGWDHGVFVPFKVIFPGADIPTVQLSLQRGLDPARHLAIGQALRPLRDEGVLIVGSGQTYHNMRGFAGSWGRPDPDAEAFDAWLQEAVRDAGTRERSLENWAGAPGARQAQPHEDHLLPLMVAAGAAAGESGRTDYHGHALGKPISGFRFG